MIGFIGVGVMGQPMALNLLRAGAAVTAWNRTPARCEPLARLGADIASGPEEVFAAADVVILMLIDEPSTDAVLGRGSAAFERNVRDRVVIQMGTMSPRYSEELECEVVAAGGRYVEAPVSGSRRPAEEGRLVAMIAGADDAAVALAESAVAPMCASTVRCGAVPGALSMKLAVNLYMIGMVTALAEAVHFASSMQLDLAAFSAVLQAGPMDSALARVKTGKLLTGDYEVQAAITDVIKNADLVADAAREAGIAAPIIDLCAALYRETGEAGWGHEDMVAVVKAIANRAGSAGGGPSPSRR
ncbi:MAG TPA: NAD(P)-dependent oxidoreductase [Microbacterium sp.]|nr:NAD(P)-dependent oxidoreductase [Microbacterium sp.]